jgi:Pyruvate/2-oxoacid:ferredoxin oxidoreductase gamma subunit
MIEDLLEIGHYGGGGGGGQGAVTAAKVLAKMIIIKCKYTHAFSEFGHRRMSASVHAFKNISSLFFGGFGMDLTMVLDKRLLKNNDVTTGLLQDGISEVNETVSNSFQKDW